MTPALLRGIRPLRVLRVSLLFGISACAGTDSLVNAFRPESAHEEYSHSLRSGGLDQTALGRDWSTAASRALSAPLTATLPFMEAGYFAPNAPSAVGYRFELRRGRKLVVTVGFEPTVSARLFVDLFRLEQDSDTTAPRRVASLAVGDSAMSFDVRRDGVYLLRIQPELLRGGRWTITQRTEGSLGFPVPGFGVPAVRSRYGVDRDAGRRRHQGIDIFARRGTPVVALVDGYAQADTNQQGGNVVWLRDGTRDRSLYYAHLDRWAFAGGQEVQVGDTLGYIGTSGNARTTPPHLHFGIYEGGPSDPLPFVSPGDPPAPAVAVPIERLGSLVRVVGLSAVIRAGPGKGDDTVALLPRGTVGWATGASALALRIVLPEGTAGYLDSKLVVPAERNALRAELLPGAWLRELPDSSAPPAFPADGSNDVVILGSFGGFELARLADGRTGWAPTSDFRRGGKKG